jgi:RimJ/RimL family protein N-acetyltransferase
VRLLFGHDQVVSTWVARQIPHMASDFGPSSAIGVTDESGQPMAGVVFHDYQPAYGTIQLSAAATSPRWATRRLVGAILRYPFVELGVHKVWTATQHQNERALKFNRGVGFIQEAMLYDHFGKGIHAIICRMLGKDYRRRYGGVNG